MGLFGKLRGKKKDDRGSEGEPVSQSNDSGAGGTVKAGGRGRGRDRAAEAAAEQKRRIEEETEQRAAAKRELELKKRAEQNERKNLVVNKVDEKKKEIETVMKAIRRFEGEVKKQMADGREAKKKGNQREAVRYAQQAKRTKERLTKHENQLKILEDQLQALEDTGLNFNFVEQVKTGNEALKELNEHVDTDTVEDVLADAREAVEKTQAVNDTFQADVNMYGSAVDDDDLLAELDDETFGPIEDDTLADEIPDVPLQKPLDPARAKEDAELDELRMSMNHAGPSSAQVDGITAGMRKVTTKTQQEIEEEELKQLETDLAV